MLKQRRFLLVLAVIVLGVAVGYAIAEGFGESLPAPAVSAVTAATAAPTRPPAATAAPARPPTATAAPTRPPTATAAPTRPPTATAAPTRPPAATAAPATASPEVAFTEYTVQPGDTLLTIARLFGLTPEEILAVNTIANPDSLDVGQVIRIPASAEMSGFIEYTVQPGDTLFTIARRFGITPEEILAVNTIANPDSLDVGQVIRIPRA